MRGLVVLLSSCVLSCHAAPRSTAPPAASEATARVFVTSAAGDAMRESEVASGTSDAPVRLTVHLDRERQTFYGVGGSLTQASAAATPSTGV